jgi:hypothetical protein
MQNHQRVAERVFGRCVHRANGFIERMFREVARAVGASAHVMEVDRKVERDPEPRRMPRRQCAKRVLVRSLVRF